MFTFLDDFILQILDLFLNFHKMNLKKKVRLKEINFFKSNQTLEMVHTHMVLKLATVLHNKNQV